MPDELTKITLGEFAKIDGRNYQTILEHVKKGNIKGEKENGRWFVWANIPLKENTKENTETFKGKEDTSKEKKESFKGEHKSQESIENTGIIDLFRREQDIQAHLQSQIEQFSKERSQSIKESRKTWIGVSIIVAIGAIGMVGAFIFILERNATKMASNQEITIKAMKDEQEKSILALKDEQKNTVKSFVDINKSNLEAITVQHKEEVERLVKSKDDESKKLELRFSGLHEKASNDYHEQKDLLQTQIQILKSQNKDLLSLLKLSKSGNAK